MDIIQAWKRRGEGQRPRRPIWSENRQTKIYENRYLPFMVSELREDDLLADDWEIVKEKKKIVIEKVSWYEDKGILPSTREGYFDWFSLLQKPPMTMTLEWESDKDE